MHVFSAIGLPGSSSEGAQFKSIYKNTKKRKGEFSASKSWISDQFDMLRSITFRILKFSLIHSYQVLLKSNTVHGDGTEKIFPVIDITIILETVII